MFGSRLMKYCRSTYLSTLVWRLLGSDWKYGFREGVGVIEVEVGNPSSTIRVSGGGGGVEVRSTGSTSSGVKIFTFFAWGFFASSTMKFLNCYSTVILFLAAYSKICAMLLCSSSSLSDYLGSNSPCFPFPLTRFLLFFRALDNSAAS